MTGTLWLVAVLLAVAATVVTWPTRSSRSRRRVVLGAGQLSGTVDRVLSASAPGVDGLGDPSGPGVPRPGHVGYRVGGPVRPAGRATPSGPPGRHDPRRPDHGKPGATAHHGQLFRSALNRSLRWAMVTGRRLAAPARSLIVAAALGALVGGLLAGPVVAVVTASYGTLGVRAVLRQRANRAADRLRRHRLDQLCALAADLRAGLPVSAALVGTLGTPAFAAGRFPAGSPAVGFSGIGLLPTTSPFTAGSLLTATLGTDPPTSGAPPAGPLANAANAANAVNAVNGSGGFGGGNGSGGATGSAGERRVRVDAGDRIDRLVRAAVRLADRTGAPLADLVERIEADMRAMDRGLAAAAAQAAGARATAWLLAALPLGGIGLGYGIGVDPVGVLLQTTVGAGCAIGATVLQATGLLWAERLAAAPGRAG